MRALALCAALSASVCAADADDARDRAFRRPSVLLITLDTTRADRLGAYGADGTLTPYLDDLARSGVRFDQALSPTPLTLPSHASIMTGLVPRRHGVRDNGRFRLGSDVPVLAELLRASGYRTAAFVSSVVLDRRFGLDRGFDTYDDVVRVGQRSAFNYQERAAGRTTRAVLDALPGIEPPFFLWVHYFDPHLPYVPPEPMRTRFAQRPYDGEIAYVDWELGGVLSGARQRAGRLYTVVVADHGESLGEHLETDHGLFVYQATQRVPLLIAGPGIPDRRVVRDFVGLVDVAPTILDLLGLRGPDGLDGRSLVPVIEGRESARRTYEMETLYPAFAYGWAPVRALVRSPYKYVDAPRPELYDLPADPGETRNLIDARPVVSREMADTLHGLAPAPGAATADADPELAALRERIEALGYVGGTGGTASTDAVDPKDGVRWIGDLGEGRRALKRGDPAGAVAPLERLLARNPRNVPALLTLSQAYLRTGEIARAVELCRRAIEIHPDDDVVHFNLANALARRAERDPTARAEARAAYERTLELNPRHADAILNYTSMLFSAGEGAEAVAVLRRAKAADVRDPDLETEIGLVAVARGDVEAARAAFERALVLNDRAAHALEGLAEIAVAEEDWESAESYYARVLDSRPTAEVAKTLGAIRLEKLGRPIGAAEAYRAALELAPRNDPDRAAIEELLEELEAEAPE